MLKRLFDELSIDVLIEELGRDLVQRLRLARFTTLGEVLDLCERVTTSVSDNSKSFAWMIIHQKTILRTNVTMGKLHPQAHLHNINLREILNLAPENPKEQIELLELLTETNRYSSLTDELIELFAEISERDMSIYIRRFDSKLTLKQIGVNEGITGERVRQITLRVASGLWGKISNQNWLFLQSSLLVARDKGDELSLESWRLLLEDRTVIDSRMVHGNLASFDVLCALLRSYDKAKYGPVIEFDEGLEYVLNSVPDLSIGLIKAINEMPLKARREVQRKVSYVGGVHLSEVARILDVAPEYAAHILRHLGFGEVIHEWYTLVSGDLPTSKWPILNAGLAMMEVCGPLEFELFCDGLRRYSSKFFDVLAPSTVIAAHLEALGFRLEKGYVSWYESLKGHLAYSDRCFVEFAGQRGPIVSFPEIVEIFQEKGYSIATATSRVLPQSPVVERVEVGLYKIRGRKHTWDDIENARNRQKTIDYNPEVVYGIDGISRYRITIGSWALNGVISISTGQQPLPNCDGWNIVVQGKYYGTAGQGEQLIWGLTSAFNALGIQIGDRVELAFDTWQEPEIRIMKIQDDATE